MLLQLLQIDPDHVQANGDLGSIMIELGQFERGTALLRRAHSMSGDDGYRTAGELAIPPMFASVAAIAEFRAAFESRLDRLLEPPSRDSIHPWPRLDAPASILQTQGLDDRRPAGKDRTNVP